MTVEQRDDYRKTENVTFAELCDIFIAKADPIVGAQMESTYEGRWRVLVGDVFLHAASEMAGILSKPEFEQRCKEYRADRMAEFILKGEYAKTVFGFMLDGQYRSSAGEAREKGLNNLAQALEADPHEEFALNS